MTCPTQAARQTAPTDEEVAAAQAEPSFDADSC
jgi:hypothetical protein